MKKFEKIVKKISNKINKFNEFKIVAHIDADGITAGAIAAKTLERLGKDYTIDFVKQLDSNKIDKLKNENQLVWFVDLGSGQTHLMNNFDYIITDHHSPMEISSEVPMESRKNLKSFFEAVEKFQPLQLNPHLLGFDGATDISGAGATYLIAREFGNFDLSAQSIVGAVGDMQDAEYLKLVGTNRNILNEACEKGHIISEIDIRYFGRGTRPIYKMLQYSSDPIIPFLTGNEKACRSFFDRLNIPLKDENWRVWLDLSKKEKRKIISEIVHVILDCGYGYEVADRVIGEVYTLKKEEHNLLRDAKEFATLLNSCGRYKKAKIGFEVAMGDRDEYFKKAKSMQAGHRKNLVNALNIVKEIGINKLENIQFFNAGSKINESIVGIVANMLLSSEQTDSNLPIIAFADTEEGDIKVSARTVKEIVNKGVNLSEIMKSAAADVDGIGGGHNIAAGATIPKGREEEFLEIVDVVIGQIMSD